MFIPSILMAGDDRDRFELRFKPNRAPGLTMPIEKQPINEDETYSFTFPNYTFTEFDEGDQIVSYRATLSSGEGLPTWLNFNAATRTFTGTPANDNVGSIFVRVAAKRYSRRRRFS